ncbi:hypothetical protein BC832DRAFT_595454 [Gaertneriomyces semiglobifer]|nr:hypothetical protein BC832DRAFT_595454 [Gaertneriomyces semiglobifer]
MAEESSWEDEWDSLEPIKLPEVKTTGPPVLSESIPRGPTVIETGSARSEYVPQVKLMKRDAKNADGLQNIQTTSQGPQKSLADKEAEYAAAKARIFGEHQAEGMRSSSRNTGETGSQGPTPRRADSTGPPRGASPGTPKRVMKQNDRRPSPNGSSEKQIFVRSPTLGKPKESALAEKPLQRSAVNKNIIGKK